MSTEDFYQDDVDTLDDYDVASDEVGAREHAPRFNDDEYEASEDSPFEEQSGQTAPLEPSAFQSLALDLTLRCGELKLTLGELQRLSAGSVLEVSGIAPGYATLCHGERVVAEGELVDVDGRLGLQITRLAALP